MMSIQTHLAIIHTSRSRWPPAGSEALHQIMRDIVRCAGSPEDLRHALAQLAAPPGRPEVPANPVNHQVRNTLLEALVAFSGQTVVHLE